MQGYIQKGGFCLATPSLRPHLLGTFVEFDSTLRVFPCISVRFRHSFGFFLHIATILLSVRKEYGQTQETSGSSADTEISTEMDG